MEDYKKTPLWDSRLPLEERLDYLLSEMTMEEKLGFLATRTPALERLGIGPFWIGGEAAHGVEARHDQDEIGVPEATTSFPQPVGMSATWDPELIRQAGRVTGMEARALYGRHPDRGLFRCAPTVDMERDPRWGRTEEGYGEDPFLTGKMASAFVRGMQGDDPNHLLISSALKHFCANNVENGRGVKSSSLDARNRHDYYYEPFRRVIQEGGATSLMTAYNEVNGVVCMLDHRVNELIREKWGLNGHVVCDGGAMSMVANDRKETSSHAETIARSLKAGVDCMTDIPEVVEQAAREAYARGWITREDVDRALRHSFATKLRLGLYDAFDSHPWNHVGEEALDSEENRRISLKTAEEAVVLLKNDGLLPLSPDTRVGLIGPLSDKWYQDWYGGEPVFRSTVKDGVCSVTGREPAVADGLDRVLLRCGEEKYAVIDENGLLTVTGHREEAEVFCLQDWGDSSITLYVPRLGRYLSVRDDGSVAADKETIFGWFVKECFHRSGDRLQTWYRAELCLKEDGRITAERTVYESAVGVPQTEALKEKDSVAEKKKTALSFAAELIEDGTQQAVSLAKECDAVILTLGCCPVINGKEDADRVSIQFPPAQRALAKAVYQANPRTVLVLLANYPYGIDWEQEHLPAILLSASGSQDMGNAAARTLFGLNAPAGRLNMTWYSQDAALPDMDDYDIMKTGRTYRYYTGKALYPFGHGLTYSRFEYRDLTVQEEAGSLKAELTVTNRGTAASDEVVQIYARMPEGRAHKPLRQLIGFRRVHDVAPGETRAVSLEIPCEELRYYDVVRGDFMVEEGRYVIEAAASSADIRLEKELFLTGARTGRRSADTFIWADHWDDYSNVVLEKGPEGTSAEGCSAKVCNPESAAWLCYRDCGGVQTGCRLMLRLSASENSKVTVCAGGAVIAVWNGRTKGFEDIILTCKEVPEEGAEELTIRLEGSVCLAGFAVKAV
ncbi:MAG: glycoside hydrolase family 3 C-terminal domain-containing protein [Lachnospiraceae bacterium]|nr:glycoside hydrolase family 3 C-terminal domain-containing protein [Lachnospiraceae bacterium]